MGLSLQVSAVVMSALAIGVGGCGGGGRPGEKPLTWKQLRETLKSPQITTVRELFDHVSRLDIDTDTKEKYADVKKMEADFDSLEKYIEQNYRQTAHLQSAKKKGIDVSVEAVRKQLEDAIQWKDPSEASLKNVTRVYLLVSQQATRAERIATWDKLVFFEVFTDDRGNILGWFDSKGQE
jgi:hypothetical protein